MEKDIDFAIQHQHKAHYSEEVTHLGIARSYRQLLPKKLLWHSCRIALNIRNIQFALDNLFFEQVNDDFWHGVQQSLSQLRQSMRRKIIYPLPRQSINAETDLQHYVVHCLDKTIKRWNLLCYALKY
jgi:hypothetical protein